MPAKQKNSNNAQSWSWAALADRTDDAYSFSRYGHGSWRACAQLLHRWNFSEIEAETILRSKWMRWASDAAARPSRPNSGDLGAWLRRERRRMGVKAFAEELDKYVRGTFSEKELRERGYLGEETGDVHMVRVTRLAARFMLELCDTLTAEELSLTVSRNRQRRAMQECASHEFCDTNEVMARAFRREFGVEVRPTDEAHQDLWNHAWDMAHAALS